LQAHAEDVILTNTGEPMRVAFTCAEEDLLYAGMYCTEANPCPVYLELNSVTSNGTKILAAGDLHSGSATLYSVLLMTDNNGSTWKEPAARIRGSALDQLQFLDPQHAWAAGEMQYPLSSDPFFLLTTDGGQFWRQRAVSEDGGPGAIQSFVFDSAQHGDLIVDAGKTSAGGRYVSYETQTGGETWMTRSKVNQLPRARRPAPEPTVRAETGKDGKAWQIERREGGQWSSVASFLVETASCGIPPPVDTPDPKPPGISPPGINQ
jgi:photosystem II stability/assembly factor-like uncharacterized protein